MKIIAIIVFAIGLSHVGKAVAPAAFPGGLYREQSNLFRGSPIQTVEWRCAFILNPDGTFTNIYGAPRAIGQWSYFRDTADTSILRIGEIVRSLRFADSTSGGWSTPQDGTVHASLFTLEPRATRSSVVNMSTLSFVRPGTTTVCGFVVGADGAFVLVRAIGPSLAQFGITSGLPRPLLQVTRNPGRGSVYEIATSQTIESLVRPSLPTAVEIIRDSSAAVGAFQLPTGSADAAALVLLPPGAYTAEVRDADSARAGDVLIEVYSIP